MIDTHVHFWDLSHESLTYDWLATAAKHPILGDIDAIKAPRYDATALEAEARFSSITGAVHIQAAIGTPEPIDETVWLDEMAKTSPIPFVIVAGVDLSAADVDARIDAHSAASSLLRGVRDYGRDGYLSDPHFLRGVARLADHGLLLDLDCSWQDMQTARELAGTVEHTPIVLEHIGYPRDTSSAEYFDSWRGGIAALAAAPNVYCKISGLGMNRVRWTVEGLRPWVEHCIQSFGPERCIWGSNWPVDRLYGSYTDYSAAFRTLIAGYTDAERQLMLEGVATALYRLPASNFGAE